mgnify:CR=1 FL=1
MIYVPAPFAADAILEAAELRLGVRKAPDLEAHAWVEVAGRPVNDDDDVRRRYAAFDRSAVPRSAVRLTSGPAPRRRPRGAPGLSLRQYVRSECAPGGAPGRHHGAIAIADHDFLAIRARGHREDGTSVERQIDDFVCTQRPR